MAEKSTSRSSTVDVTAQQLARIYATGLCRAAENANQLEAVVAEAESLVDEVMQQHPRWEEVLRSALVSPEEKEASIQKVLGAQASPLLLSFLKVLARHSRLELLRPAVQELRALVDEKLNRRTVQVTFAQEPTSAVLDELKSALVERLQATPVIESSVDPSLIGGMLVRVDDTVYDASVATRLSQAEKTMVAKAVQLIQAEGERLIAS